MIKLNWTGSEVLRFNLRRSIHQLWLRSNYLWSQIKPADFYSFFIANFLRLLALLWIRKHYFYRCKELFIRLSHSSDLTSSFQSYSNTTECFFGFHPCQCSLFRWSNLIFNPQKNIFRFNGFFLCWNFISSIGKLFLSEGCLRVFEALHNWKSPSKVEKYQQMIPRKMEQSSVLK